MVAIAIGLDTLIGVFVPGFGDQLADGALPQARIAIDDEAADDTGDLTGPPRGADPQSDRPATRR